MRKYSYLCSLFPESVKDEDHGQRSNIFKGFWHCDGPSEPVRYLAGGMQFNLPV
jgi:hypothetical protein